MKHELFNKMQQQMTPSPEVRAALSEKLARPAKKRPAAWKRYTAAAACAALVIGAFSVYHLSQDQEKWMLITRNFRHDILVQPLHSYVTAEDAANYVPFNAEHTTTETGSEDTGSGGSESLPVRDADGLPGGAYVGDVPIQEGAEDYELLMARFNGTYPDWYGGAYLDRSGHLVVQLVEDKDPGDKSLELQVQDWTGDSVMFTSCKYSLNQLKELMDQLNALPDADLKCGDVMAGWGIDEEANRIELTLTQVNDHILSVLAELDPEDDAIYVRVGQRASTDSAKTEEPAVHYVVPGGAVPEDDENLIADEPVYDGAHYDLEHLPEQLPEQKQSASEVGPVLERYSYTLGRDPDTGFIDPRS